MYVVNGQNLLFFDEKVMVKEKRIIGIMTNRAKNFENFFDLTNSRPVLINLS